MANILYNCPACGNANREGARFCDSCGAPLTGSGGPAIEVPDHLAEKLRDARTGERKHVTVMFADVSGSMDLAESVDAEAWRTIMDRFFALLCEGVHAEEGTVVQFTGDGIMALFGAPIAHEDHAARAARAALDLGERVAAYAAQLRRDEGLNFSARIGLNSGEVVVGAIGDDLRVDYTAIGHTVGLAQRMESIAEPGRTYLTEHTAALLEGFFDMTDLGHFEVKGVREPLRVFVLDGLGRARTRLDVSRARGFSSFVGRAREAALLTEALERALAGEGGVIGIVGDPGIGKSRLCHEFAAAVRARGVPVYEAAAAAHARNVPFYTALELLRSFFSIGPGDDPRQVRERVAGRLLLLDTEFAEDLPLVFDFIGAPDPDRPVGRMDPEARKRRLHSAVQRLVLVHGERESAVNVIEDLHWIDDGSQAFLDTLVKAVPGKPSLVVVNYRPEYRAEWMAAPWFTALQLTPLGPEAIDDLLDDLLGSDASLAPVREQVRARTAGNPFFVEELVRGLAEQGVLAGRRGERVLAGTIDRLAVPESVHAVLAARIDRLEGPGKSLLQTAAVLGREFAPKLLGRAVGIEDAALTRALRALEEGEFIAADNGGYAFVHPLTQEVAYNSLLAERRREVHAAVATAIEELHPDGLDERAALIAHHRFAAGQTLEAARWHARAAAWAGINDPLNSAQHWRRVRELCDELAQTPETLALGLVARTWILQYDWRIGAPIEEVERDYEEACELAKRSGDEASLLLLMSTYAGIRGIGGDMAVACAVSLEALRRAEALDDADVWLTLAPIPIYALMVTARFGESLAMIERAVELADRNPASGSVYIGSPRAWMRMMRAFTSSMAGDCTSAPDDLQEAVRLARLDGDAETEGWAWMVLAQYGFWSGHAEQAVEHAGRAVGLAEQLGSPFSRIWTHYVLGFLLEVTGHPEEAHAEITHALDLIDEHRTGRECESWARSALARVLAARGDLDAALASVNHAFALMEERTVRNGLPLVNAAHARILRLKGDHGPASEALDAAEQHMLRDGSHGFAPMLWLERADLAAAAGDREGERLALEQLVAAAERCGAGGWAARGRERLTAAAARALSSQTAS